MARRLTVIKKAKKDWKRDEVDERGNSDKNERKTERE
jgi:hypothetical protein